MSNFVTRPHNCHDASKQLILQALIMIELFAIFSKGGLMLWCVNESRDYFKDAVNALIENVILQVSILQLIIVDQLSQFAATKCRRLQTRLDHTQVQNGQRVRFDTSGMSMLIIFMS